MVQFQKFGSNGLIVKDANGISVESLRDRIPSIFATSASEKMSARYAYIPTIEIVNAMRETGMVATEVRQSGSRLADNRGFGKHLIRFQHANTKMVPGQYINQAILVNSHNGACSLDFSRGCYVVNCANGLCSPVGEHDEIKVRHSGNVDDIIDATFEVVSSFEAQSESIENMRRITLTPQEQSIFSESAMALKVESETELKGHSVLLKPRRIEDTKPDLWTTFNVVQENMVGGGRRATPRGRKMRAVNGIDESVKLNRALWLLAENFAKLKG